MPTIGQVSISDELAAQFHDAYYRSGAWRQTKWMGVEVYKAPTDLWIYAELVYDLRPEVIIETGTAAGGSALWFAHLLDSIYGDRRLFSEHGRAIVETIDKTLPSPLPEHPRIRYTTGDSADPAIVARIHREHGGKRVLVSLDSDHSHEHVRRELQSYSRLASYIVVEDTNVTEAKTAVEEFLREHPEWEADTAREKFFLTFNPRGYLRRK